MTDPREINFQIDHLTGTITRTETLNALHACRPDHPLGRDNPFKWRNADALVQQLDWDQLPPVRHRDWLKSQAEAEG